MSKRFSHPMWARNEALGAEITELCGYLNAATHRLLELLRQFDQEELWALVGVNSCAHWLNHTCGISMNTAREKVRVANALGGLDKISAAFARGEISYSKVRAMTRVATPDNEDYLLQIARFGTANHMESMISKYRRSKRLQDSANAQKQHEERCLRFYYEADGSFRLEGRLPAEVGALVMKALEKAEERRWREKNGSEDTGDDVSAETEIPLRHRNFPAERCDALAEMAEVYLAGESCASSTAERYQVVVHVSAETLADGNGERSELEDGPEISAQTARRLACEASRVLLVEDDDGEPLNIGRKSRAIPPAMRRALKARDQGCKFPGCLNKRFVDGHHIQHWAKGGETSLANLVQLCRHHHRLVHEGGFGCVKTATGQVLFTDQRGDVIPQQGYQPPLIGEGEAVDWLHDEFRDCGIDPYTTVCKWDGQPMDHHLAVWHLYAIEERAAAPDGPVQ